MTEDIPEPKIYQASDWFTRMDEQLDSLIRLQIDQNNLLREFLGKVRIHPPEPGFDVTKTIYKGVTIHRSNGEWTVTYGGESFTGTWEEVISWLDNRVVIESTEQILTDIHNILEREERPVDVFSLALTIPADTAEGAATSVTENTTLLYEDISYVILHFPDAARLKAKVFLTCNGTQILPIPKKNDAVNYVAMRNATQRFPLNYKVDGLLELMMSGWNSDTENSHQVFALVGARQKVD